MLLQIFSPSQVLRIGLKIVGMSADRQKKQQRKTNIEDFRAHYGTDPFILAQIWEDLQRVNVAEARIDTTKTRSVHLKNFLRTHHFLMRYETEKCRKVRINNTEKTVRKWQWYFIEKMIALRVLKVRSLYVAHGLLRSHRTRDLWHNASSLTQVFFYCLQIVWPEDNEWKTNFIISIDGVNTRFHEMKHPTLCKNPKQKDHKSGGPGLSYELALHLWKPQLVWLNGPQHAGENNDLGRYQKKLKAKIPDGKVAITDGGYSDKKDPKLSQPNSQDTPELRTFKARARMRQEAFHSRIMKYNCLTNDFRHDMTRHGQCFEAICIICVYEMELLSPMWDV